MITDRTIRVFVSSTFRYMEEERNYLVKFTYVRRRPSPRTRYVKTVVNPLFS